MHHTISPLVRVALGDLAQHPRTPGAFWDAIGWNGQIAGVAFDGDALRCRRRAHGLTQAQVAALIGAHHSSVSEWENGAKSPIPAHRRALADLFPEGVAPGEVDRRD